MRIAIFTLMRLGPSLAYAIASMFILSMLLLESYPSSASVWWLHMTILPVMREPIYLLLAVPGIGIWSATVLLMLASIFGIRVALQPQRHYRSGFIHAHIALIATGLTMGRAAVAQADLSAFAMPQLQRGDWSFLPLSYSPLGTVLFISVFLACVCCHVTIIKRTMSFR
ncbi:MULTISPECIES: hypothetical protein [Rhizobium]|uniref:hypothetical protein n=1 Tax=Rhizobium TaxID=379 RepID=UPI0007EC0149|nr:MULTISPECIES: hypothetical protein [Rhizobium]ANK94751.1 hypothetical protein AMK01_PC00335 [Rhizobium sp. N6212]ANL00801.1 hypothetical protein AMK00_PC00335 [Rhizobium sp. N621]ANL06922.1 hypothetical protein AMJ99_PC00335 [Rhizobium esperanzae]ANL13092.1 hypothetical protein AMJ98_PD00334 [Rhizobium sp. N1341]ANL25076.1 hypothetical protein AMJ96_PC00334 [Rhizobium sp. N113]